MSNTFRIVCKIERTNSVGHRCFITKPFYLTKDMAEKIIFDDNDNIDRSAFMNEFIVENDCKLL